MKIDTYGTRLNDVQQLLTYNVLILTLFFYINYDHIPPGRLVWLPLSHVSRVLQFVGNSEQNIIREVCCVYQVALDRP